MQYKSGGPSMAGGMMDVQMGKVSWLVIGFLVFICFFIR
jgi:hypothetical protein